MPRSCKFDWTNYLWFKGPDGSSVGEGWIGSSGYLSYGSKAGVPLAKGTYKIMMDNEKPTADKDYTMLVYSRNNDVTLTRTKCDGTCEFASAGVVSTTYENVLGGVKTQNAVSPAKTDSVPAETQDTPAAVVVENPNSGFTFAKDGFTMDAAGNVTYEDGW